MIILKGFLMFVWILCLWFSFWNNITILVRKDSGSVKEQRRQTIIELVGILIFVIWYYL